MATLTVSITGSAVVTGSRNFTISDAALQKVVDWAREAYPPAVLPDTRTNAQIMAQWMRGWMDGTRDAVQKRERDAAEATARVGVPPIDIV